MRIVVGTDGSVGGQAALRWALGFALAAGGELVVASAWQPTFSEVSNEEFEVLRAEAHDGLDGWCAPARAADVPFREVLLDGDPRARSLLRRRQKKRTLLLSGRGVWATTRTRCISGA